MAKTKINAGNEDNTSCPARAKRSSALVLRNGAVSPFPFVGGFSRSNSWAFTSLHHKKRKARAKE